VLRQRLAGRVGHFMPPALLESQLETLEEPAGIPVIDAVPPPAAIVADIRRQLGSR
jgi:gluconokinase